MSADYGPEDAVVLSELKEVTNNNLLKHINIAQQHREKENCKASLASNEKMVWLPKSKWWVAYFIVEMTDLAVEQENSRVNDVIADIRRNKPFASSCWD